MLVVGVLTNKRMDDDDVLTILDFFGPVLLLQNRPLIFQRLLLL